MDTFSVSPDFTRLLFAVQDGASWVALDSDLHGPRHWRDVARVGLALSTATAGSDPAVVLCFALLHDTQRRNDHRDPKHGQRAARFAERLAQAGTLTLTPERLSLLRAACEQHTGGPPTDDPTLGCCLDADRLTMWRVGTAPKRNLLSTRVARKPGAAMWSRELLDGEDVPWERIHGAYQAGEPLDPLPATRASSARRLARTEELHPELRPYLRPGEFGMVLHHPLLIQPLYTKQLNRGLNQAYEMKVRRVQEASADGDWGMVLVLHERPYRLRAFRRIADGLDDRLYWELLGEVWTDAETISQDHGTWLEVLSSPRPQRERLMDAPERAALAALDEEFVVYRGFDADGGEHGLSWTLDEHRGRWFARRFAALHEDATPRLASARVRRGDVIAHFIRRGEREIVALPDALHDITVQSL